VGAAALEAKEVYETEDFRDVVVAVDVAGLSYAEAAAALRIPLLFVAEEARSREDPAVRLLDEILRILARAGEAPRGAVEPVEVVAELRGVEPTLQSVSPPVLVATSPPRA